MQGGAQLAWAGAKSRRFSPSVVTSRRAAHRCSPWSNAGKKSDQAFEGRIRLVFVGVGCCAFRRWDWFFILCTHPDGMGPFCCPCPCQASATRQRMQSANAPPSPILMHVPRSAIVPHARALVHHALHLGPRPVVGLHSHATCHAAGQWQWVAGAHRRARGTGCAKAGARALVCRVAAHASVVGPRAGQQGFGGVLVSSCRKTSLPGYLAQVISLACLAARVCASVCVLARLRLGVRC